MWPNIFGFDSKVEDCIEPVVDPELVQVDKVVTPFPIFAFREALIDINKQDNPKDAAIVSAKLFADVKTHYRKQVAPLLKKLKTMEYEANLTTEVRLLRRDMDQFREELKK